MISISDLIKEITPKKFYEIKPGKMFFFDNEFFLKTKPCPNISNFPTPIQAVSLSTNEPTWFNNDTEVIETYAKISF